MIFFILLPNTFLWDYLARAKCHVRTKLANHGFSAVMDEVVMRKCNTSNKFLALVKKEEQRHLVEGLEVRGRVRNKSLGAVDNVLKAQSFLRNILEISRSCWSQFYS